MVNDMNKENIIIDYLNHNNGYITSKSLKEMNINYYYINKFINKGIIERVSIGLYKESCSIKDEYFILQQKYSYAIFSHLTALFLLNLTDRVPFNIDLTVPRDKKIRGSYNIHRISDKYYSIGIIDIIDFHGNSLKVYNTERCVCDLIRNNEEFDVELQNRIFDYYFNSESKDIDKLLEYAKIFGIYDKVKLLTEVMMKW